MSDLDLDALRAQTIRCRDTIFDGNAYDYFVAILGALDEVERLRVSVNKAAGFISTLPMCSAMHPQDVLAWLYADTPVDGVL